MQTLFPLPSAVTAQTLPQASCVACLEEIIESAPVTVGPVAVWEGSPDAVIEVIGRIRLRGYFNSDAARWICRARGAKGLFGKGYVAMKAECLSGLPFVK